MSHRKSSFRGFAITLRRAAPRNDGFGVTAASLLAAGTAHTQVQTSVPGKRSEILRALPVTRFYHTPHALPAGKAGELIRSQSFEEYELPPEVSAVRILTTRGPPSAKMWRRPGSFCSLRRKTAGMIFVVYQKRNQVRRGDNAPDSDGDWQSGGMTVTSLPSFIQVEVLKFLGGRLPIANAQGQLLGAT